MSMAHQSACRLTHSDAIVRTGWALEGLRTSSLRFSALDLSVSILGDGPI